MDQRRLVEQNPWWRDPTSIDRDPKIRQLADAPFRRVPAVLDTLRLDRPNVYTLRGPRQVGKSTSVKMLIQRLIADGFSPRRILYLSVEMERRPREIYDAVVRAKKLLGADGTPWVIFIDELSWVRDWQSAILSLRDHTDAADDCFVLTGSSARDIRRGGERLPGRRGPGTDLDKILLPLSFGEFLHATDRHPGLPACPLEDIAWSTDTAAIREAMLHLGNLSAALDDYAHVGGFPTAVADFMRTGDVSDETYQNLWRIIAGDIERASRDSATGFALLHRIVIDLGSSTSWSNLAEEMAAGKAHTAREYADTLADSFLVFVLHFLDLDHNVPAPKKDKKLYPTDPLLAHLPAQVMDGARRPNFTGLIESILGMALFRAREAPLQEGFGLPRSLYYWRSTAGKEVDFLSGPPAARVAVESKYAARVTGDDRRTIRNAFRRGLIASRETLDLDDDVRVVPAPVLLALLG